MKESLENIVTQDTLAAEGKVREYVKKNPDFLKTAFETAALTKSGVEASRPAGDNTEVEFYAVLKPKGKPDDIVRLDTIPLDQLYPDLSSKRFRWARAIDSVIELANEIVKSPSTEVHVESEVSTLFGRILALKEFLGMSSGHNQVISSLFAIVANEGRSPVPEEKVRGLAEALSTLRHRVHLPDAVIEVFEDRLDEFGIDHLMPMTAEGDDGEDRPH